MILVIKIPVSMILASTLAILDADIDLIINECRADTPSVATRLMSSNVASTNAPFPRLHPILKLSA
jgi:hypothetical protein